MGNTFKYFCILALLLMLARPPQALAADDSAGTVLAARRTAWSDRKASELLSKNPIFTGELLTTNQVGRLQVLFHDDSILMMAPDTQTRITEYLYSGGADSGISMNLARGVTRIISGKVTEEGGMINVSTPEANVGIRGTDVLIRHNPEGVTEIAVLQGTSTRPTTVCLPGMLPSDCHELGHRQGIIISGRKISPMDRGGFNNFSNSYNPNKDAGVSTAGYTPPTPPPANTPPGNPGGGVDSPTELPQIEAPTVPIAQATYAGSLNHANGFGSGSAFKEGRFSFTVSNLDTAPILSSVNFYARIDNGTEYKLYMNGSGLSEPVTNGNHFNVTSGGGSGITTNVTINGTPDTYTAVGNATCNGTQVDWSMNGYESSNNTLFTGVPVKQ